MLTIERLPNETSKAYLAFAEYAALGSGRSFAALARSKGKNGAYVGQLERWSSAYNWQLRVAEYDKHLAQQTLDVAANAYREELEENRIRYKKTGEELHQAAKELLEELLKRKRTIDYTPTLLSGIVRAFEVAANLEAHALGLDKLLSNLDVSS
jgi:hypothetical protein